MGRYPQGEGVSANALTISFGSNLLDNSQQYDLFKTSPSPSALPRGKIFNNSLVYVTSTLWSSILPMGRYPQGEGVSANALTISFGSKLLDDSQQSDLFKTSPLPPALPQGED